MHSHTCSQGGQCGATNLAHLGALKAPNLFTGTHDALGMPEDNLEQMKEHSKPLEAKVNAARSQGQHVPCAFVAVQKNHRTTVAGVQTCLSYIGFSAGGVTPTLRLNLRLSNGGGHIGRLGMPPYNLTADDF